MQVGDPGTTGLLMQTIDILGDQLTDITRLFEMS